MSESYTYQLRRGGSEYGLSMYKNVLSGCLRKLRLAQNHPDAPGEGEQYYFNRGTQFHALFDLWLTHQKPINPRLVTLEPADHPAARDTTQWDDTCYLWEWFQTRLNVEVFGKVIGTEHPLGPRVLWSDLELPLTGYADAITQPTIDACAALDVMFQGMRLTDLAKHLGRPPVVMWDVKVIGEEDTASYIDDLQSVAYMRLAELQGIQVDCFAHLFVFRGKTHTYILESRKKSKEGEEKKYIPNPNHKWFTSMFQSEPPSPRRIAILRSFMAAVRRRVSIEHELDGRIRVVPHDEPNATKCRRPGMTCWALERQICGRI